MSGGKRLGEIHSMEKNRIQNMVLGILCFLGCFCIIRAALLFGFFGRGNVSYFLAWGDRQILSIHCPAFLYMEETNVAVHVEEIGKEVAAGYLPIYDYMRENPQYKVEMENQEMIEKIILNEGQDENHVPLQTETGPGAMEDGLAAMEEENRQAVEEEMRKENANIDFVSAKEKAITYDLEQFRDFETLLGEFYVLDSSTTIDESQLNLDALLGKDMTMKTSKDKPQILIYHTHSQEAFADSVPGDESTTILGAGEKLAELLRAYGFNVIHHTGKYDVESRDYAYSNAAPAIEQILAENPSIEVIIDLHRDGVAEGTRLVTNLNGRPTAQFMFFNGLSRTKKRGDIDYLKNDNIGENLAFSFQAQLKCKEYYPGLARKIYLKGYRYNMHYRGKSLLIEVGAQTNTVEEIMNAMDPIAHVLYLTLSGEEN
ncbi:MAG: stage II sporulation protein P [Lachnospiraceae bacterium]|nr:stage II sporulation protein P [Lachnospiraceae bacterium]